jgi:hypothetical protein
MSPDPQPATSAAGPAAALLTCGEPAVPGQPGTKAKRIVYGLLGVAIPLAVLVVWVMAAASASATGGCGGG